MAILFLKDSARAFGSLGRALVFGALMLLAMEGVVTPASGFTNTISSFGLRYKTRLGGNPSMTSSYSSMALVRRDSACRKNKGRPGWGVEKSPATIGGLRPMFSLLVTAEPESGEGLRSEDMPPGPPSGPPGLDSEDMPPGPPSGPQGRDLQDLVYGETAARSFVKALVWRITAAIITLISGLVFSGSLSTAMSIVGSDFVTKSGFMFAGERLWNKVKWGQGKKGDSAKRSLAKALLWRVFAASNTLVCGVFLARDLSVASKIAGSDTFFKTALFFVNERAWTLVEWGKQYEPEYFI